MSMLKLFDGCKCPQKTMYVSYGIYSLFLLSGILVSLLLTKNNEVISQLKLRNKFTKYFIVIVLTILLMYLLIDWCCKKNYKFAAWILAGLPLVSLFYTGYMGSSVGAIFISKAFEEGLKMN